MKQKNVRLAKVADEVKANFAAWFERNFRNERAGRIGDISYARAGALDDLPGDGIWYIDAYERAYLDHTERLSVDELAFLVQNPLIAFQIALGITDLRGLRCFRRGLTQQVNRLQRKSYRSRYYAEENARRRLRHEEERRKIRRRTTTSPCPTPDEFRRCFSHVKDSVAAKIRFGGMVHDLECYVDNRLRIDERGEIVGRNHGIRGWIADNVPELSSRYKTIMRYKALAIRLRQAAGVADPTPTSTLLIPTDSPFDAREDGPKNYSAEDSHLQAEAEVEVEILRGCPNTMTACFSTLERMLDKTECSSDSEILPPPRLSPLRLTLSRMSPPRLSPLRLTLSRLSPPRQVHVGEGGTGPKRRPLIGEHASRKRSVRTT